MLVLVLVLSSFLTSSSGRTIRPTAENLGGERNVNVTKRNETIVFGLEYEEKRYSVRLKITHGWEYPSNDAVHCTPITLDIVAPQFRYVYFCHPEWEKISWLEEDGCIEVQPFDSCNPGPHTNCQSFSVSGSSFDVRYRYFPQKSLVPFEETNLTITYEYSECHSPGTVTYPPATATPAPTAKPMTAKQRVVAVSPTLTNLHHELSLNVSSSAKTWIMSLAGNNQHYSVRIKVAHYAKRTSCRNVHLRILDPIFYYYYYGCKLSADKFVGWDGCLDVVPSDSCVPPENQLCSTFSVDAEKFQFVYEFDQITPEQENVTVTYEYTECLEKVDTTAISLTMSSATPAISTGSFRTHQIIHISPNGTNLHGERNFNASNSENSWRISLVEDNRRYSVRLKVILGRRPLFCNRVYLRIFEPDYYYIYACARPIFGFAEWNGCLDVTPSDKCTPSYHPECSTFSVNAQEFSLAYVFDGNLTPAQENVTVSFEYTECPQIGASKPLPTATTAGGEMTTVMTSSETTTVTTVAHPPFIPTIWPTPSATDATVAGMSTRDLIGWNLGGAFALFIVLFVVSYYLNIRLSRRTRTPPHVRLNELATISETVQDEPPDYDRLQQNQGHVNHAMGMSTEAAFS